MLPVFVFVFLFEEKPARSERAGYRFIIPVMLVKYSINMAIVVMGIVCDGRLDSRYGLCTTRAQQSLCERLSSALRCEHTSLLADTAAMVGILLDGFLTYDIPLLPNNSGVEAHEVGERSRLVLLSRYGIVIDTKGLSSTRPSYGLLNQA
ncbi:hypothetical protein AB1N83_007436 [Pleurotus pulmonarius]